MSRPPALVLALAGLVLAGCIERKETITVDADGRVAFVVEHVTDSHDELYLGDPVPSLDNGWLVEESVEVDDEGEETFTLRAEAAFPPGLELPSNYAARTDPDPDIALQFPTTLAIEARRDGTYYHFRRVYTARPWAVFEHEREHLEKQMEEIEGLSWEDMSPEQHHAVVRAFLDFELYKVAAFSRLALRDVAPDAPQDVWLHVHAALRGLAARQDVQALVDLVTAKVEGTIEDEVLDDRAAALLEEAKGVVSATLRDRAGFGAAKINGFVTRAEHHGRYHDITGELADDEFEITVEMPGEIVGHNGHDADGRRVTWEFNGAAVRDRDLELMVTSRVP